MRVLLVEDDTMIGEAVSVALRDAVHDVNWARNGRDAIDLTATRDYDVILLDLGLPICDGIDVLRTVRHARNAIPIIVITARSSSDHKVDVLDQGADDYLVKPFVVKELLARMRAVTRRASEMVSTIGSGSIAIDPATKEAIRAGVRLTLTRREFALLEALLKRAGAVLSRAQLERQIYGSAEFLESNTIEYTIYSLRRKLGTDAITNVRGMGWMVAQD